MHWSAMSGQIEDRDHSQCELVTAPVQLQLAKGALAAAFGHLKQHSCSVQAAEAVVLARMKSKLRNYIQTVWDRSKQSPEGNLLSFDGNIF